MEFSNLLDVAGIYRPVWKPPYPDKVLEAQKEVRVLLVHESHLFAHALEVLLEQTSSSATWFKLVQNVSLQAVNEWIADNILPAFKHDFDLIILSVTAATFSLSLEAL